MKRTITRREILAAAAVLPTAATTRLAQASPSSQQPAPVSPKRDLPVVEYYEFQGPGKPNLILTQWAMKVINEGPAGKTFGEGKIVIHRRSCEVYLPKEYSTWFTDNNNRSNEAYLWYGPVKLVEDFIIGLHHRKGRWDYYLCRTDDSIRGRRATPMDFPNPKEWLPGVPTHQAYQMPVAIEV